MGLKSRVLATAVAASVTRGLLTRAKSVHLRRTSGEASVRSPQESECVAPYPPKTNGKTERPVQTPLRNWAYVRAYQDSSQ